MKKTIYLCIAGSTQHTPEQTKSSKVIIENCINIEKLLEEQKYSGHKVIIVANGDKAYIAAKLAYKHKKQCLINNQSFEFTKNCKSKLSYLDSLVVLVSQANQEKYFLESSKRLITEAIDKTPREYSYEVMRNVLNRAAPDLILKNGSTAKEHLANEFLNKIEDRKRANRERISVEIDNKNIIALDLTYEQSVAHILKNKGTYLYNASTGDGKTERAINPLMKALSESSVKSLFMTSTILLTNALCSDERNYKNALANDTINDQSCIVSCLYSALLSPAFKQRRKECTFVAIEEMESCRDALTDNIVGREGTLEQKVQAQSNFNEVLTVDTLVITDSHLSKESADHILKTTGRPIYVIKPVSKPREQKNLTYYANKNIAIDNIRNTLEDGRALTFDDSRNEGSSSKFRVTDIQIEKDLDIKSIAVTSDYFKKDENINLMNNPTEFANQYDHILTSPAMKNGVSIKSKFDLNSLLCHQTISLLDVLQQAERDRPNINKALYVHSYGSKHKNKLTISSISIFEQQLTRGISRYDVDTQRIRLKDLEATKDIVNRIKHNNEMRSDYANNLLCMFELKGYNIEYNYDKPTKEMNKEEKLAIKEEEVERYTVYKTLDKIDCISKINEKEENSRTLDEKRMSYAADVFSYFNIDNKSAHLEDVFKFDMGGFGRKKINNLSLVHYETESEFYNLYVKEIIFKKLFKCLSIDNFLNGQFSKSNYNDFYDYVTNGKISIEGKDNDVKDIFATEFPHIKYSDSTWLVKNLLREEFGLRICEFKREAVNKNGDKVMQKVREKGTRYYLMTISQKTACELMYFYQMAFPYSMELGSNKLKGYSAEIEARKMIMGAEETNQIVQDFDKQETNNKFYERVLDKVI